LLRGLGKKRLQWFGHVERMDKPWILRRVLESKCEENRTTE
jgi:hypothetical protein